MQIGSFELTSISGGRFKIDGGTMFGVVPRKLWRRLIEPDEHNLIRQATNCVLIRTKDFTALIDTGYGNKLSEKQQEIFQSQPGHPLIDNLREYGVEAEDIDMVILSHLHFDHAGGATSLDDSGELVLTFPNAVFVAQQGEWEIATAELPELRGAYPQDNLLPIADSDQLKLIEGDVEIAPGIRGIVTPGHTEFHMAIVIEGDEESAIYLGDLCPTWHHLPTLWCMSYDVNMLETRRTKSKILSEMADQQWLGLSDHDPDHVAARIVPDARKEFAVSESFETL